MATTVDPLVRNNVRVTGASSGRPIMFLHGFGGTQESWRLVAPAFEGDHPVIHVDQMGAGGSDMQAYDRARYDSLNGYADDVVEVLDALGMTDVVFVGHSVSAIIGVLAANQRPELFHQLILLGPSPRYIDDPATGYEGGFSQESIDGLLDSMDINYRSWSDQFAPMLLDDPEPSDLSTDLADTIHRLDPAVAAQFARATFLSDNRRDLADVRVPTTILQGAEDNIASPTVGRYVQQHIPESRIEIMPTRGHVPHLSSPDVVVTHLRRVLQ